MNRRARNALAAAAGLGLDRLLGEPPAAIHPVAGFGRVMNRVERTLWRDARTPGIAYAATGTILGVGAGRLLRSTAATVALAVAGRELRRVARQISDQCSAGDLDAARRTLPALVGRDPSQLDESGIAAAVIESLAENSVDAVVAPVFWAVLAGAPGAAAYRAINTMDAMVGQRSTRYARFGWAAARLDDAANYLPARLFALLVAVAAPHEQRAIWAVVRRDAPAHPSPNAGVAEAAVAAALGLELGGPLRYGDRQEIRPRLGSGPRPQPADIVRAIRLVNRTERLLIGTLLTGGVVGALRLRR
ncbi:MAG: adenosylcobinamide-phosphate synthase CbiB [Acidimicrobiia bacterium]